MRRITAAGEPYGLRWRLNVFTEDGGAVLIRALEPEFGIYAMIARRGTTRSWALNVEDRFKLARFKSAQKSAFATALAELRAGRKQSHWMWFIFPQLQGLGYSPIALFYGISSIEEARAYLDDPVLGERLRLVTAAALAVEGRSATAIFGFPDDLKFRSSMTLFGTASEGKSSPFQLALERYFAGEPDARTLALLRR